MDMPLLANSLGQHHLHQLGIPAVYLGGRLRILPVLGNYSGAKPLHIQFVGTYKILYLPHVEDVLGDIVAPFFPCYDHGRLSRIRSFSNVSSASLGAGSIPNSLHMSG